MKQCSKCNTYKYLTEFYKSKITKDGFRYQCKNCILLQSKNWQLNNKTHKSETGKRFHLLNKDLHAV